MKDSNVGKFSHAMIQIVFILLTISLVFPFLWLVLNSFKTNVEFYKDIWAFPEVPQIQNYIKAWTEVGLSKYFLNSVVVTLLGTGASVLSAAMPAYVVAKFKFRGRNFVYNLAVLGMVIPGICSFGSLYKLMIQTNLINSHLGLIIYYSGGLGMLSGDHIKSSSDLGLPLIGVGLFYQKGYVKQVLNKDGWQGEQYPENDWAHMSVEPISETARPQ
jgi:ABC-type glycerol-3-phosphate transport system permease component